MSEGLCLVSGNFFSCMCRSGLSQRLEKTHLQVSRSLRVALPALVLCSQNSRHLFSRHSNFCLFNQPDFWALQPRNCPWAVSQSIVSSPYHLGCHFLRDHSPILPLSQCLETLVSYILSDFPFFMLEIESSPYYIIMAGKNVIYLLSKNMVFGNISFSPLLSN